jgi:hypothetical protein
MRFLIASLALLFSAGLATSQTDKLNFRTLSLGSSKLPELWVAAAGKSVPITFSSAQPSLPLKADKGSPLKIHKSPLGEKGKPTDPSPTLVDLPASSSILLLGWKEEEKPSFLAVADPFTTAKSDDWLLINHTEKKLTFQIGGDAKPVTLEPKSQQLFKCTAPVGEGAATTVSSTQEDGSLKTVYSSYWPITADQRGLVVVVQNGARVNVNFISDPVSPKAAPKRR